MEIRYALIKNNKVENVIIADADFIKLIENDYDHIELLDTLEEQKVTGVGWSYINGAFVAPIAPPVEIPKIRIISKLEYMNRFTDSELANIYTAAKSVVQVEIWLEKFKLALEINLDDDNTINGLKSMEIAGLIAVGRATEILS